MQNSKQRQPGSGRLVYAHPRTLPSYPSAGLRDDNTAASIAASVGWKHQQKLQESPLPQTDWSALPAALSWPQSPSAPSPKDRPSGDLPRRTATNPTSLRAATTAAAAATASPPSPSAAAAASAALYRPSSPASSRRPRTASQSPPPSSHAHAHAQPSMTAATLAATAAASPQRQPTSRYRKSYSVPYPGSVSSRSAYSVLMTPAVSANLDPANARTAVTAVASKRFSFASETGSVPLTTMSRQMYTADPPPVGPESFEQKHYELLQASALAMARRMYNPKAGRGTENVDNGEPRFASTLQEVAYKRAQERLERIDAEYYQQGRGYRDYYVGSSRASLSTANAERPSLSGASLRRRLSLGAESMLTFGERAETRHSTSFEQQLQQEDRQAVLAAAQRNVRAQMRSIDEQVYVQSGKVRPSRRATWEGRAMRAEQSRSRARAAAAVPRDQRREVNLGGGCWMAHEEIERIAAERVRPLLDEINERAAQERQREEEQRRREEEQREQKREQEREKKELQHQKKQVEKAHRATKRSMDMERAATEPAATEPAETEPSSPLARRLSRLFNRTSRQPRKSSEGTGDEAAAAVAALSVSPTSEPPLSLSSLSSGSPKDRVKRWIRAHFARPRTKSSGSEGAAGETAEKSFIGGHTLAQSNMQSEKPEAAASAEAEAEAAEPETAPEPASEPTAESAGSTEPPIEAAQPEYTAPPLAPPVQPELPELPEQTPQPEPAVSPLTPLVDQPLLAQSPSPMQSGRDASTQSLQVAQVAQVVSAGQAEEEVVTGGADQEAEGTRHELEDTNTPRVAVQAEEDIELVVTPGSTWAEGTIGAVGAVAMEGTERTDTAKTEATKTTEAEAPTTRPAMAPLVLPIRLRDAAARENNSPVRDSRFLEDLH